MGCILAEMMKLDILVFQLLSFLSDNPVVCFILCFICGKLTVFIMILLLILIFDYMVFDTESYIWKRNSALY